MTSLAMVSTGLPTCDRVKIVTFPELVEFEKSPKRSERCISSLFPFLVDLNSNLSGILSKYIRIMPSRCRTGRRVSI